ncbi:MAG: c-type cytochrome [Geminicoccaceae bacterium]
MPDGVSAAWIFDRGQARRYAVSFSAALSFGGLIALIPAHAGADEPDTRRQKEIMYLLKHDCGSCHGMSLKGGLGPSLRPDVITAHDDDLLVETILNGRPGTPMAPWRISLSEGEARWLVTRLKEGIDGAE